MSTTNIPAPPANHKGCEVNQNRDQRARQAAFQPNAHTQEMLTQTQPRARSDSKQSGGMNCALLQWVAQQDDLPPHLQAILLRLVKLMDEHGSVALSQADIAPHIRLGERQTRAAIKDLVALGALHRKRRGAVGKGRAPDTLSVNFDRQRDNGGLSPVSVDNSDSAVTSPVSATPRDNGGSGGPSPVSQKAGDNGGMPPVSKKLPHIENAPARAEPLTNLSTTSRDNPETPESGGEGGAGGEAFALDGEISSRAKPKRQATERSMPKALTPAMVAYAGKSGFVNGSVEKMFADWRNWHIAKGTMIADHQASWRTWVDKRVEFRERDSTKARTGLKPIGVGPDGVMRYAKNQRTNVYRS